MSPSVDFDTTPMWLPDSKHLIFVRRPGLPFGLQAQQGGGGIGLPNGPAFADATAAAGRRAWPAGAAARRCHAPRLPDGAAQASQPAPAAVTTTLPA